VAGRRVKPTDGVLLQEKFSFIETFCYAKAVPLFWYFYFLKRKVRLCHFCIAKCFCEKYFFATFLEKVPQKASFSRIAHPFFGTAAKRMAFKVRSNDKRFDGITFKNVRSYSFWHYCQRSRLPGCREDWIFEWCARLHEIGLLGCCCGRVF